MQRPIKNIYWRLTKLKLTFRGQFHLRSAIKKINLVAQKYCNEIILHFKINIVQRIQYIPWIMYPICALFWFASVWCRSTLHISFRVTLQASRLSKWSNWDDRDTKVNSSPPGQNVRHFTDDIFKCIIINEKFCILIQISLKFVSTWFTSGSSNGAEQTTIHNNQQWIR